MLWFLKHKDLDVEEAAEKVRVYNEWRLAAHPTAPLTPKIPPNSSTPPQRHTSPSQSERFTTSPVLGRCKLTLA